MLPAALDLVSTMIGESVAQKLKVVLLQGSPTFLGPRATFWILIKVGAHLS